MATLDQLSERYNYYPSRGRWWVSLVDEADQMIEKAQLRCLSLLDSTSWLRPRFGGGFEQGTPPPVIWVFTCNGVGANQTGIPSAFEKRFLSRCIVLKFPPLGVEELAKHLHQIWLRETAERVFSNLPGLQNYEGLQPMPDFRAIAQECYGLSVRDALMKLEVLLLGA